MNSNDVASPAPVPDAATLSAPPTPPSPVSTSPPPPPVSTAPPQPPPPRQRADFAASAAMANDILGLGDDASPAPEVQPTTEPLKPRAVPELDESMAMALSFNGSPMAPDFFTSSRSKPKKRLRKFSR